MRTISRTEKGRTRKSEMRETRQVYELCNSSRRKDNREGERERERKIITVQRNTTTERDREGSGKNGWKEMKKEM